VLAGLARCSAAHCSGRKPPVLPGKRPARPHKSAMQNRFTMGNTNAEAETLMPRAGPDGVGELEDRAHREPCHDRRDLPKPDRLPIARQLLRCTDGSGIASLLCRVGCLMRWVGSVDLVD
jgi:hypothetical protein